MDAIVNGDGCASNVKMMDVVDARNLNDGMRQ